MTTNVITTDLAEKITVRLANSPSEIEAAQRIRYKVFYEEYNAVADEKATATHMDVDDYDAVADHLIVLDESLPPGPSQIVGTYRLLRRAVADKFGKFYTSGEYDIAPLLDSGAHLLELGRSCVLPPYRTRPVLQKLWQGIAHYVAEHKIGLMFGCASLHGTDVDALAPQLSYLYHYHLATPELRARALESRYVEMNCIPKEQIDAKKIFTSLPPLVKGYMRLGASVGDGAVIDPQFNTTDVCIVMPTHLVTQKYFKHYQRVTNNQIVLDGDFAGRIASAKVTG
ncbi:MAG TPA: GNAT family N-acyltransferase [Micavibrio sp.]|nr:GNAT family N-acyltransferase [Micavibrio sp.]